MAYSDIEIDLRRLRDYVGVVNMRFTIAGGQRVMEKQPVAWGAYGAEEIPAIRAPNNGLVQSLSADSITFRASFRSDEPAYLWNKIVGVVFADILVQAQNHVDGYARLMTTLERVRKEEFVKSQQNAVVCALFGFCFYVVLTLNENKPGSFSTPVLLLGIISGLAVSIWGWYVKSRPTALTPPPPVETVIDRLTACFTFKHLTPAETFEERLKSDTVLQSALHFFKLPITLWPARQILFRYEHLESLAEAETPGAPSIADVEKAYRVVFEYMQLFPSLFPNYPRGGRFAWPNSIYGRVAHAEFFARRSAYGAPIYSSAVKPPAYSGAGYAAVAAIGHNLI